MSRRLARSICGMSERGARYLVAELLDRGLLESDSEKGPLRLGLPASVVPYYFPRLYPEPLEQEIAATPAGRRKPKKRR